jgi:hypothetical protein
LEELQDDILIDYTRNEHYWIDFHHKNFLQWLKKIDFDASGITLELYQWATNNFQSRSYELSSAYPHVLVPMADLFNHNENAFSVWGIKDGEVALYNRRGTFKKGAEVFISYGGDLS